MSLRDLAAEAPFGRLTVLERVPPPQPSPGYRGAWWRCACACGAVVVVRSGALTSGVKRSCGRGPCRGTPRAGPRHHASHPSHPYVNVVVADRTMADAVARVAVELLRLAPGGAYARDLADRTRLRRSVAVAALLRLERAGLALTRRAESSGYGTHYSIGPAARSVCTRRGPRDGSP